MGDPRRPRHRPAHGRARRDRREHRAALGAAGPRLLRRPPAVDRHRLRAGLRQPAAARRPARRPVRPQADVRRRPARLRRPPPPSAAPRRASRCSSAPARCRASFGALLAPAGPLAADDHVHRPARTRRRSASSAPSPARGGAIGLLLGGVLTEYLSWRWAMYVNLALRHPGRRRRDRAARTRSPSPTARGSTCPASLTASARPVRARLRPLARRDHGWSDPLTSASSPPAWRCSAASSRIERRVRAPAPAAARRARPHPRRLVPRLRDRRRRHVRRVPVPHLLPAADARLLARSSTGLAFLPMVAALMVTATLATARLAPRFGPRPLVPVGMLLAAAGDVPADPARRRLDLRGRHPARR